jgi:hypothetical protein
MSKKRYVDLDAMRYYDSKWKLKFEELVVNNDELDEIWEEVINDSSETTSTDNSTNQSSNGSNV